MLQKSNFGMMHGGSSSVNSEISELFRIVKKKEFMVADLINGMGSS